MCSKELNKNDEIEVELPSSKKEKYLLWSITIFLLLFVISLHFLLGLILIERLSYPVDWQSFASFGSSFQVLASLFSGLAFVALIATLVVQMRDLRTQRMLVKETIIELKEAASAQKEQSRTSQLMTKLSILNLLEQSYQKKLSSVKAQGFQNDSLEQKHTEVIKEIENIHNQIFVTTSMQNSKEIK